MQSEEQALPQIAGYTLYVCSIPNVDIIVISLNKLFFLLVNKKTT